MKIINEMTPPNNILFEDLFVGSLFVEAEFPEGNVWMCLPLLDTQRGNAVNAVSMDNGDVDFFESTIKVIPLDGELRVRRV